MAESIAPQCAFKFKLDSLRLGEFDMGGVLYHANYYHVYEMAREALLCQVGVPYPKLVAENEHLAIVESKMSFLKPVLYGQPLEIRLWLSELRKTSVIFNYEIVDSNSNSLLHQGFTRNVFVKLQNSGMKPVAFRDDLREGLSGYCV